MDRLLGKLGALSVLFEEEDELADDSHRSIARTGGGHSPNGKPRQRSWFDLSSGHEEA